MNRKEAPYYFLDENMDDLSDDDVSRNRGQEFECEEDRKAYHNALERKRRVGLEKQLQKLRNAAQVPSKTCKIGTLKCASKFIEEKQHAITKHFQEMAQLREENEMLDRALSLIQEKNCSFEEAMRIARAEVNFNCQNKIRSFSDVPMKEVLDLYKKDLRNQGMMNNSGRLDVSSSGVMAGVSSSSSSQQGCGRREHTGGRTGKTGPSLGKYGGYSGVGGDDDSDDSTTDDDIDEYLAGSDDDEEEEIEGIDELGDTQAIGYQEVGTSGKVMVIDGILKSERGLDVQVDSDSYGSDGSADDEFFLEDL